MLSARLRVGDRMIGIGFIEGTPPRLVGSAAIDTIVGITAIRPPRRARNPRAAFIIPGAKRGFGPKQGGGTTESTPGGSLS